MIFQRMCEQNQYDLPGDARYRVLLGFNHLYKRRDRHFGNGRLARNAFEESVRRLADRIAEVTQLSESLLTSLTADDISMPGIPPSRFDEITATDAVLRVTCEGCRRRIRIPPTAMGTQIKCTKCGQIQKHDWAGLYES